MKTNYKKFSGIKKRTLINFVDWYENHIRGRKITPEEIQRLNVKFYENKHKLNC